MGKLSTAGVGEGFAEKSFAEKSFAEKSFALNGQKEWTEGMDGRRWTEGMDKQD